MMKKIGFILIFMVFCGSCTSKESEKLDSINPGFYEIKFALNSGGETGSLKMSVRYSASGVYKGSVSLNETRIEEFKGRYKVENGKLKSYDKLIRTPDPKSCEWSSWQSAEPSEVAVRDIQKTSYQYYCRFNSKEEKDRCASLGLTEGWKTYTRISD